MLPRFRVVAVSMERLEVRRARIMMITIDVIDLDPVALLEDQPTIATAPTLLLQQLRQSRTDVRVPSLSRAPVHPITIVRTAVARDLNVPRDRHLTMAPQEGT